MLLTSGQAATIQAGSAQPKAVSVTTSMDCPMIMVLVVPWSMK